ncbi:MAG: lysophospholipid transporter LplT [Pseudomonadota bacterium]|nr:lysophospholipid transporter LplT [Pseudomonadota bacterium]
MTLGFYIILLAQFLSALADNALLFAAIALLGELDAPPEFTPILQQFFVVSYILLAPFVGAFSDALPKGRVMLISNAIKLCGCLAMLAGVHPMLSYAVVGLGAAAYSPAKYGILTEYLPPSQLVLANSWMEGLTVLSIILGAVIGGKLLSTDNPDLLAVHQNLLHLTGLDLSPARLALLVMTLLYLAAAFVNLYIPRVAIDHAPARRTPWFLLRDFFTCLVRLWRDPLGKVSLAVTTLFWGVGATIRLLVLDWADQNLDLGLEEATQMTAWSALGIAVGAVFAARLVKLEKSLSVLPVGIAMGAIILAMLVVHDRHPAIALLLLAGAASGFFVVPMNALLQHRGHLLMGAGHSIAVQNFNENLSILLMLGAYAGILRAQDPIHSLLAGVGVQHLIGRSFGSDEAALWASVVLLGAFISGLMALLWRRYRNTPYA